MNTKISNQQRRLFFSIIKDIKNSKRDFIASMHGKIIPVPLYLYSIEEIKEWTKLLNMDYPRIKDKPESMAAGQIDTKSMTEHIRWLETTALESHMVLRYYTEEMERLGSFSGKDTIYND